MTWTGNDDECHEVGLADAVVLWGVQPWGVQLCTAVDWLLPNWPNLPRGSGGSSSRKQPPITWLASKATGCVPTLFLNVLFCFENRFFKKTVPGCHVHHKSGSVTWSAAAAGPARGRLQRRDFGHRKHHPWALLQDVRRTNLPKPSQNPKTLKP